MKDVKPPAVLTEEEYAEMMREFVLAGQWMSEQLKLKRGLGSIGQTPGISSGSNPPQHEDG